MTDFYSAKTTWKEWAAFVFLGVLGWGISFLWIKVALLELKPITIVAYRMFFGAAGAWGIAYYQKFSVPLRGKELVYTLLLGLTNTAIPIMLITWSETRIDSGLAGILNGTVPLFTIVIAHFFLHDERMTVPKVAGLMAGFVGIILLMSGGNGENKFHHLSGQLAMVTATLLYAVSNVFARIKLRGQNPIHTTAVSLLSAWIFTTILALSFESPLAFPTKPMTWLAIVWMGVIGLAFAYQAYFFLLNRWGATRSTLVTYLIPVAAVTLGVVFLGERPSWYVIAGGSLVIGGIAIVNAKWRLKTS